MEPPSLKSIKVGNKQPNAELFDVFANDDKSTSSLETEDSRDI